MINLKTAVDQRFEPRMPRIERIFFLISALTQHSEVAPQDGWSCTYRVKQGSSINASLSV